MDIIGQLQDGNGALAWLTAVLLALGGTAVVVAFWTQLRRGVPAMTVFKAALGLKSKPVRPQPTAASRPPAAAPLTQAVAAYQTAAQPRAERSESPARASVAGARPVLTERQLTVYLTRLRLAADSLEEVAHREASAQGAFADDSLLATHYATAPSPGLKTRAVLSMLRTR